MPRGSEKVRKVSSSSNATPRQAPASWRSVQAWVGSLLLISFTMVAYLPALNGQFVWDDDSWTTNIVHLLRDFSGLRAMWCNLVALQQYFPLSGTTFWIDYHLW